MKIKKIDHVAVCVRDLDEATERWRTAFGIEPGERESVESQKTDAVFFALAETHLELVAPAGNAGLERFLEKRGPGLHHIALEVEGIEEVIAWLTALGVPMIDESPRAGARGHRVAFVHPRGTGGVLVELVEPPLVCAPSP